MNVDGTLYGTTEGGDVQSDYGTVFTVTTSGMETVVYDFKGGTDGAYPAGSLVAVHGALYGTTMNGGGTRCHGDGLGPGCGTIFAISSTGVESVVYRLKGGTDGYDPGNLLDESGTLYATTFSAGRKGA